MALIKVLIIFVVILALLNKRLPLYLAMIFGSLLMIVMFRLPIATAGQTALRTLTGWDVWSVNLAMYVISVLVYELDLRHRFEDAQRAMNGLMRDPRLNTSLACMFIGLMQGPATVTICGGMVDTMAGDHLKNDEKAAVATYLRHIPEAMVPTFTGVIVACSISGISISSFFVWMIPIALLTLLAIYLVYLRRVPRTVGETGRSKKRVRASAFAEPVVAAAGDRGDHRVLAADVGSCSRRRGCQRAGRKILRAGGARYARQGL